MKTALRSSRRSTVSQRLKRSVFESVYIDNTDVSKIAYTGSVWSEGSNASAYGGGWSQGGNGNPSPNEKATLTVTVPAGKLGRVSLIDLVDPTGVNARWRVDGGSWTTFTQTAGSTSWQRTAFTTDYLAPGTHTIEVERNSGTGILYIDAFKFDTFGNAVMDTFAGANGANLHGRASDTGHVWTVRNAATFQISSNQLEPTSPNGTPRPVATVNSGWSNGRIEAKLTRVQADGFAGITFRLVDDDDFWDLVYFGIDDNITLQKNVAGVVTNVILYAIPSGIASVAQDDILYVELNGNQIIAGINRGGVDYPLAPVTDSTHQTGTHHGVWGYTAGAGTYLLDNFKAIPL